jgi:hypothetical protein
MRLLLLLLLLLLLMMMMGLWCLRGRIRLG